MPDDIKNRMSEIFQNAARSSEVAGLAAEKMKMPSVVLNSEETGELMKKFFDDYTALFASTK